MNRVGLCLKEGWSLFLADLCRLSFPRLWRAVQRGQGILRQRARTRADVGNKYASFRIVGIEGIEQK
jgi:hypothetical protein